MNKTVKGIVGGDEFFTEILIRGLTLHGAEDGYYVGNFPEEIGNQIVQKYGVHFRRNINDFVPNSAILFLIFEPHETEKMLSRLADKVTPDALIVSVVADLKLETLEAAFPNNEIVRLFITPSIISGQGLGAYVISKNASMSAKSVAQIILNECGDVVNVDSEDELDMLADFLTVNSYISYVMILSMMKKARQLGMSDKEATFAIGKLFKGTLYTLLDNGTDTSAMIMRGTMDKKFRTKVTKLIETQGIKDELEKFIEKPVYAEVIEAEEESKIESPAPEKSSAGGSSKAGGGGANIGSNQKVKIRDKSQATLGIRIPKLQMHFRVNK